MTPQQMAKDALAAIAAGGRMTLVLPIGVARQMPSGELLSRTPEGNTVYSYDPAAILSWLTKKGLLDEDANGL